jgi:hypothetical protein
VTAAVPSQPNTLPRRLLRAAGVVLFLTSLFALCLWLNTRNNDFPVAYHVDEPSKAQQVIDNVRNYRHPQLLVELSQWAVRWWKTPPKTQDVVQTGRWVSAVLAALASVMLAGCGYLVAGPGGMVLGGLSVGLCPSLLVYAHHMKEDAALALGVSFTVLAMAMVWRARSSLGLVISSALLGLAVGLAISAKFVGVAMLAPAVASLLVRRWPRWWALIFGPLLFLVVLTVSVLSINHRALSDVAAAADILEDEINLSMFTHRGVIMDRPNRFIVDVVWHEVMPHAMALAALWSIVALVRVARRERGSAWGLLLLLTILYLGLVLSLGVLPFHRYGLPVVMLAYFVSGLGAALVVGALAGRGGLQATASVAVLLLIVGMQLPRCLDFIKQFRDDGRAHMQEWARSLPPGTRVLAEQFAGLTWSAGMSARIVTTDFVPAAGEPDELMQQGYDYVVMCENAYGRYVLPFTIPEPGFEEEFARRRRWYQRAFALKPAWANEPAHSTYSFTNPTIRIYRVADLVQAPEATR